MKIVIARLVGLPSYIFLSLWSAAAVAQSLLPNPTGPFAIGRVTYHWVDSARVEALAQPGHNERELMVDVWYPAEPRPGQPPAPYLPDLPVAAKVLGEAGARKAFGIAYDEVTSGRLLTHAVEGAPFAKTINRCPMIIFSHGLGVLRTGYTAQIEDLVSHGYVVIAIGHTYDTWLVSFPDGRVAQFDKTGRQAHSGSEAARNEYGNQRLKIWAADIRFAIDQLIRYDREADFNSPLAGHLDLKHIGTFGHSDGGRAAALACQTDTRIGACLDLDGVADNLPFSRDAVGATFKQPFLVFVRKKNVTAPSDDDLKEMGYSREEFPRLLKSVEEKQTSLLKAMPGGSYRLTLKTDATHMSFSDLPLIENVDKKGAYLIALQNEELVRTYTLAFFDETLRGKPSRWLGQKSKSTPNVEIEWFSPGTKSSHSTNRPQGRFTFQPRAAQPR